MAVKYWQTLLCPAHPRFYFDVVRKLCSVTNSTLVVRSLVYIEQKYSKNETTAVEIRQLLQLFMKDELKGQHLLIIGKLTINGD
jgi:hypothetical protein